jgi:ATP phosphoribosyltransferase
MSDSRLTLALPKGRMLVEISDLFEAVGIRCKEILEDSRKLIFDLEDCRVLVVRSQDVITYVEHGAADIGVVGKDVLLEQSPQVYEPLDLGLGRCHLSVARAVRGRGPREGGAELRVATKYPKLAEEHFRRKGVQVEIIKLYGSIELAPLVDLADRIVDLVSTGETLRQNGLEVEETILESTSRLIVNRATMKTRTAEVLGLVGRLKERLEKNA